MLYVAAFINDDLIDMACIHNLTTEKKGKYKYEAWLNSKPENKITLWHKREDGWMKLAERVLKEFTKGGKHER
jgi:hypothetical protein